MARFRAALRPIQRIKHVIDSSGGLTAGTASITDIVRSVDAPVIASTNQCVTGSKVNGIYLRVEVLHSSGAGLSNIYMMVVKNVANNIGTDRPAANAVGISEMKRYVIHQEMVMMNGDAGNGQPRTLFNGVIKFPRGYIRNGPSDRWEVVILSPTVNGDFCLQCHYKEFR